MGISLKDFGNFAVGAIEQDKVNTKERFAIRNEELQANRASLIKRKDARYAKDIAAYDAEKKKYDTLKAAAANFKNKTIDNETYAAQYFLTTMGDNFTKLPKDKQTDMISDFNGKTVDYTLKGSADEIEKKYAMQEANINKVTAKALEDARGDSFLIKQIIGESKSAKKDLATQVETALKANETILSSKSISEEDSSLVGIPVKGTGKINNRNNKFNRAKNSEKYQDVWNSNRKLIDINLRDEDAMTFINLAKISAAGDEASFKYDKTDSRIVGIGNPAAANIEAMKFFFNQIKDNRDNMVNHYFDVTNLHGNIGKTWNKESIAKQTVSTMDGRWGNITEKGWNGITDARLTTIVPLNIVNANNEFVIGDTSLNIDKEQMSELSKDMNDYIVLKSKAYRSQDKNLDEQGAVQKAYLNLYNGNNKAEFLVYLSDNGSTRIQETLKPIIKNNEAPPPKDTNTTQKTEPDASSTNTTKTRIVTPVGIKDKKTNTVLSWEKIEKQMKKGKVKLTTEEQAAFEQWKLGKSKNTSMKKGTTYEDMMKETQANNQMIVDAFNPNKNKMTQGDTSRFSFNNAKVNTDKS
jgi:hypothetical protein